MNKFFSYIQGDSLLHRLNPLTKLAAAFLLCAACFVTDSCVFCLALIAFDLLAAFSAGAGRRALAMLRILVKLCAFLFVFQVLFISQGQPLLTLPLGLKITDLGLEFSLLMTLRLVGAALPLALVLSVTRLRDLSAALTSGLRVPYRYAFALTTAIRFIPLFSAEMAAIIEAQTARGVEFDTSNPLRKIRLIFPLCVPMLVTAVRKTDDMAVAAELRGFNLRRADSSRRGCSFRVCDAAAISLAAIITAAAAQLTSI